MRVYRDIYSYNGHIQIFAPAPVGTNGDHVSRNDEMRRGRFVSQRVRTGIYIHTKVVSEYSHLHLSERMGTRNAFWYRCLHTTHVRTGIYSYRCHTLTSGHTQFAGCRERPALFGTYEEHELMKCAEHIIRVHPGTYIRAQRTYVLIRHARPLLRHTPADSLPSNVPSRARYFRGTHKAERASPTYRAEATSTPQ